MKLPIGSRIDLGSSRANEADSGSQPIPPLHVGGYRQGLPAGGGLAPGFERTLIDDLLADQARLTAVETFSRLHSHLCAPAHPGLSGNENRYQALLPAAPPAPGQQYAFEVDLDRCSGCKACVTACHSLNGLDEDESWRSVGLLVSPSMAPEEQTPVYQHVTTACHHCVDPGCLNGCPVLAYDKDPVTGIVRHLDDQCMGCSYCVMKCPYEVPRYSHRLGIVRKCDMCRDRLAVGEAPACAQACPSDAIRITVVDTAVVQKRFSRPADDSPEALDAPALAAASSSRAASRESSAGRLKPTSPRRRDNETDLGSPSDPPPSVGGHDEQRNAFLSDTPDPRLTLPTTRYVSRRPQRSDLAAADRDLLRLDAAHGPLVAMLVLTQASAGLWMASALAGLANEASLLARMNTAALLLLTAGLASSVLHLGRPSKAWRAFLGWRRSWLSREIIIFNVGLTFAFLATLTSWLTTSKPLVVGATALAAVVGVMGVLVSSMVYIDTGRPLWGARFTVGNFVGTTVVLGSSVAGALLAWVDLVGFERTTEGARWAAAVATVTRAALFAWRGLELRRALENVASPVHWNARVIAGLLPGTLRWQTVLFLGATLATLLALDGGGFAPFWATIGALCTFAAEWIGRHVFFAAGGARRMPGGVAR